MEALEIGVYVHVPFCVNKCPYCDFNSYSGKDDLREEYVDSLCKEMAMVAEDALRIGERLQASTLYIGGGTPTLLSGEQIRRILRACAKYLGWNRGVETTVEANPGTIDYDSARELRQAGVNRISLGVQSLDVSMLRSLGRVHGVDEALGAFEGCRAAGFENINLDLMYALPGQSAGHWETTLRKAIRLAPEHLSLYPLAVEEGTPFHRLQSAGKLTVPSDDEAAEMYEAAEALLAQAGYEHYEISNWAAGRTTFRCRHNLIYWMNRPYLGFGAGAHSYVFGRRYNNVLLPERYVDLVNARALPVDHGEQIDADLEMRETIILGLRLLDGISRREFADRFARGLDDVFGAVVDRLEAEGLLFSQGDRVALTSRGILLGNEVFRAFI